MGYEYGSTIYNQSEKFKVLPLGSDKNAVREEPQADTLAAANASISRQFVREIQADTLVTPEPEEKPETEETDKSQSPEPEPVPEPGKEAKAKGA